MSSATPAATRQKPKLHFWDIWNMSFGFLGIQFGFALQNANVSRIFETLGANVDDIPILWVAAPLTGLIIQPIIGYFSDRTWTKLGRRRPYFLAGAILASLALFVMPNSPSLWFAAGMLWIMDASINITMEPFRAFVGDNLPSSQRTTGFAMQSFFIGIGAIVASSLPYVMTNWFDVPNQAAEGIIPNSVKWSFYLGGTVFLLAVLWTVIKSNEYPPEELNSFADNAEEILPIPASTRAAEIVFQTNGKSQLVKGGVLTVIGLIFTWWLSTQNLNKELYIFSIGLALVGLLLAASGYLQKSGSHQNGFVTMMNDFEHMPPTMKQLAVVQFFSWFALFAMWIYMTPAVTSHLYGTTDTTSKIYNDGADWVGLCMGVYNGISALVAFAIPVVARLTSRRMTHLICLVAGGLGLLSVYFLPNPNALMLSMIGVGIAWASILSVPYAMLAGSLPAQKMGYYMGVFNFFIVIPQIVAAALLGFLVKELFAGEPIFALVIGGVSMIVAGLLCLRVKDQDDIEVSEIGLP
ncbi:MFS transporter [Arundinibacter roseus]|uniref:MFS transporter n=1 Tax=Arundinibacter roseus TaxID=2070510 RepID=A0A4R4KJI2_9BACT|nr:MFS transporter [Arundinibacter roseus]TDB67072.1 MFS transporter [Arundinibacter roseus]